MTFSLSTKTEEEYYSSFTSMSSLFSNNGETARDGDFEYSICNNVSSLKWEISSSSINGLHEKIFGAALIDLLNSSFGQILIVFGEFIFCTFFLSLSNFYLKIFKKYFNNDVSLMMKWLKWWIWRSPLYQWKKNEWKRMTNGKSEKETHLILLLFSSFLFVPFLSSSKLCYFN